MARALRIEYEGAIYHIVARGNLKQAIFRSARDRLRFLDKLEETARRHQLRVYAWTLMTTHYHLLLCTPRANLSRAMHQLQSSYSTYVRTRHNLSGHVFGGRYKARLVEGDPYLLALTRYIHLNPIQTRSMRERPLDEKLAFLSRYVWSSHRDYCGMRHRFDWLMRGPLLHLVAEGRANREVAYRQFVERGAAESDEELDAAMARSSKAIGSAEFCSWADEEYHRVQMQQGRQEDVAMRRRDVVLSPDAVRDAVARELKLPASELTRARGNSFARDLLIMSWRDFCGLSNREIGHRLGHADGATVGKRFAQLSRNSDHHQGVQKVAVKVKKRSIDNCKA
jgi:putative transposase